MTVIVAVGGIYTPRSHMESYNLIDGAPEKNLGFDGITDVTFVMAGGSIDVATGNVSQDELIARFTSELKAAAS